MLTYASTNTAEDGKYRRIQVKLAPRVAALKAKLDYRQGYYAPTTFAKMTGERQGSAAPGGAREREPGDRSAHRGGGRLLPAGQGQVLRAHFGAIPGSALSFRNKGAKAATELDFIGEIRDARGQPASTVRDTIPLKLDQATAGQVTRKQIQYDTGLTLGPGKYTLKFRGARERRRQGRAPSRRRLPFPTSASGNALRLSSVILSNQMQPLRSRSPA